jgi:hypothetical protein
MVIPHKTWQVFSRIANRCSGEAQGGRQSAVSSRWTFVQREQSYHCDSNLLYTEKLYQLSARSSD